MINSLKTALGLSDVARVAFVGSGGKTTAIFQLAREYLPPVIVTATSHLEIFQLELADRHFYCDSPLNGLDQGPGHFSGVTLFTGARNNRSVAGLDSVSLKQVLSLAEKTRAPLLIEADGSRRHSLKAPAQHEPPIPDFVDTVVVTVGLSALGKPFTAEHVHRPEIFASLSGLQLGDEISIEAVGRVLSHPSGGLKNIPSNSRRVALLNQADTDELRVKAHELAVRLLPVYHSVIVASLRNGNKLKGLPDIQAAYK